MFLISSAAAQTAAAEPPSPLLQLIPFVVILVIFYFLLIRPQQQARKKHEEMVNAVRRGDEVVTAGGLVGKVTKVPGGDEITVQVGDGVEVTVVKATLSAVRSRTEPDEKKK
ncbi:preprotein translocase, YajC subunit [Parvularcula bermudensis HTCC2503]|uniref:Sec translocon accessory complex subunit YajC n=1 Tax=Parvularcula bermudensis (strain ATCC BAA-594 / HTCC2503 / KCTC 12087) TaxID=314260 RepID=E0TG04_PARBH|nr:preprotein translocase subunit YajC [Parvularcula bermudensis]ADM10123.1 preprotein translocase, YajC subunit [Parvularcula bermudensis HTCC2503]